MTRTEELSAVLYSDGTVLCKNSAGVEKLITLDSYKDILGAASMEESGDVTTDEHEGALSEFRTLTPPQNMISLKILEETLTNGKKKRMLRIMCLYPERTEKLVYEKSKGKPETAVQYRIRYPRILLCHSLNEDTTSPGTWVWETTKYFVAVNPDPSAYTSNQSLFNGGGKEVSNVHGLPFNNCYDEGKICFGSVEFSRTMSFNALFQLDWMYTLLSQSPFNNDVGFQSRIHPFLTAMQKYPALAPFKSKIEKNGEQWWYSFLEFFEEFPYDMMRALDPKKVPETVSFQGKLNQEALGASGKPWTVKDAVEFLGKVESPIRGKERESLLELIRGTFMSEVWDTAVSEVKARVRSEIIRAEREKMLDCLSREDARRSLGEGPAVAAGRAAMEVRRESELRDIELRMSMMEREDRERWESTVHFAPVTPPFATPPPDTSILRPDVRARIDMPFTTVRIEDMVGDLLRNP